MAHEVAGMALSGQDDERPRRVRRRGGVDTRRAIIEAAGALFSRNGFAGTSLRDIAAEVGISEPAIYRHFTSKKHLLNATLAEYSYEIWSECLDDIRRRGLSLEEALVEICEHSLKAFDTGMDLSRLLLFEALSGEEEAVARYRALINRRRGVFLILFAEAGVTGETAEALATDLVSAIWGTGVLRLAGVDPLTLRDEHGQPTAHASAIARRLVQRLRGELGQSLLAKQLGGQGGPHPSSVRLPDARVHPGSGGRADGESTAWWQ